MWTLCFFILYKYKMEVTKEGQWNNEVEQWYKRIEDGSELRLSFMKQLYKEAINNYHLEQLRVGPGNSVTTPDGRRIRGEGGSEELEKLRKRYNTYEENRPQLSKIGGRRHKSTKTARSNMRRKTKKANMRRQRRN